MKIETSYWNQALSSLRSGANASKTKNQESVPDDPQSKRLQDLKEGLQRLRAQPSPRESARQAAKNKVGWLKQRLDALKMMLLHASPEQAKALARELKSIAKELSSAAKSLGAGQSGGGTPETAESQLSPEGSSSGDVSGEPMPVPEAASPTAEADAAQAAAQNADPANEAMPVSDEEKENGATQEASGREGLADSGNSHSAQKAEDRELRNMILEAQKLLKAAIESLKSKLAAGDKESKQDLHAAEKSMAELDQALVQDTGNDFYTSLGELSMGLGGSGLSVTSAISGMTISLSA